MRVGLGYDVHRLGRGYRLIIGGVEIPYELGLIGHSDADVLVHAIMDALLGAAALGDIGKHFPDTDEKYRGISSIKLLEQVGELLASEHYIIENIDAVIIAERPKMRPYIEEMNANIAKALGIEVSQVNVKATTEEGLGFTGSGEGISSQAICMLSSADDLVEDSIAVATDNDSERSCNTCSGCMMQGAEDKPSAIEASLPEKKEDTGEKEAGKKKDKKKDRKSKKDKKEKKEKKKK